MGNFIPVEPEKWAEMVKALAEVERLRASSFVTAVPVEEYEKLKAEVERLRKAGDAMERSLSFAYPDSPKIKEWNAAKEGKQS